MRGPEELLALVAAGAAPNLAYLAIGLWLLRGSKLVSRGVERWAIAYALGTGVSSLAILALRAVDIPIPLPALAVVAALGLPAARAGRSVDAGPDAGPPRAAWVRIVDAGSIALSLLTLAAALGPETSWDGLEYHLPMVAAWSEGPIRALPAMLDSEFRAGVDLLFLPAVAAGWPDAAAAVSACFALTLAALVRCEAMRRTGSAGAGALAGFLTLAVSFTLQLAPTTYVDLGVGVYGFLALLFADRWNRDGEARSLLVSALFIGFAVNAKLHAAVLIPAIGAMALLGGRSASLRIIAGCAAIVAVVVAPWFAKAAATTGNPLFPFFGDWLGTGPTHEKLLSLRRFRLSTDIHVARNPLGLLQYLIMIHFGSNPHVSGLLGPLPLALGVLAIGRLSRATVVLVATLALLFLLQFVYMPALRFGSPLLPFLALAAAVGGERLARSGRASRWLLIGALALVSMHHLRFVGESYLPRIASLRSPEAHERAKFPDQVNLREVVARAEPVVGIPMGAVFWMPKPVYVLLWQRNGELFFNRTTPPRAARSILRERGVRSLVMDVAPPLPMDGTLGHPIVDAWIREGSARLRPDPNPLSARGDKVWVLVDLE